MSAVHPAPAETALLDGRAADLLAVTGIGVVAAPEPGLEAFVRAIGTDPPPDGAERSHAVADFDVRTHLGRRGTSTYDRATSLALVACGESLRGRGELAAEVTPRVGVTIGTTAGSLHSMSEYTRETLVSERPYLVNPSLFPNTVMNCAAGQAAIRYRLGAINSTIAGAEIALFQALRQASRALRLRQLDAAVVGASEELSPQREWLVRRTRSDRPGPEAGEGAAMFVVERAADARGAGRTPHAFVEAATSGFHPGAERGDLPAALAGCARRALRIAGASPGELHTVALRAPTGSSRPEAPDRALALIGVTDASRLTLERSFGDCGAASSALQLAALIAGRRALPGRSLMLGWTRDGGVAAAVVRVPETSVA